MVLDFLMKINRFSRDVSSTPYGWIVVYKSHATNYEFYRYLFALQLGIILKEFVMEMALLSLIHAFDGAPTIKASSIVK
jgi:hypothetical protein